jgi:hypothetical protein
MSCNIETSAVKEGAVSVLYNSHAIASIIFATYKFEMREAIRHMGFH